MDLSLALPGFHICHDCGIDRGLMAFSVRQADTLRQTLTSAKASHQPIENQ
jgi:hypothetical protein